MTPGTTPPISSSKMTEVRDARIAEIKRIWRPGMSIKQILAAIDLKNFCATKTPSRNVIAGLFHRNADLLAPCELLPVNGNANANYLARRIKDKVKKQEPEKPISVKYSREKARVKKMIEAPVTRTPAERAKRFQLDQSMLDREPIFKEQQKNNKAKITLVTLSFMKGSNDAKRSEP